ncbi:hypothetical protein BT93_L3921 [Corymbia citriodora subsp. variegata]|uniref:Uncharacterized protein n=1 Tax=Corymbia citriodora subsp. variegata TaxID=360336 RepID=A0A8T0CGM6_CORYI|nr:hypothetical protein BT93_L3921 [Corymbia citriodora subsp. variegata]
MGMRTHSTLLPSTIVRVAMKATSMKAKERNRKQRPIMIFLGNVTRKSCGSYREVKMAKNSKMAVTEENKPKPSEIAKTKRESSPNNKGTPLLLSLPSGTVKAIVNNTVAIRVDTSIHEFDVSFIHFSPFSNNFS